tara:strand:- start:112961 stop:113893 length:933 start_codon:yes stop_codon:yes gene_type:complete
MDIFITLFVQIIPLLALIGIGYVAGKKLSVNMHSMSMLSIYILVPFVIAISLMQIELKPSYIAVPIFLFFICAALCHIANSLGKRFLDKEYRPLMPLLGGTANTGYFGIPIVTALLGPAAIGVYMLFNMAFSVTEVTTSYYLSNRSNMDIKQSIKRVLKLPPLYGIIAGFLLNITHVTLPDVVYTYWTHATGAFIIIGMMLIGVGISQLKGLEINLKFTGLCFIHKYLIWPLTFTALIIFDKNVTHLLDSDAHLMLFLLGVCPLPANAVAYATQLKLPAEETAVAILLSTIFALVYVPSTIGLYYMFIAS